MRDSARWHFPGKLRRSLQVFSKCATIVPVGAYSEASCVVSYSEVGHILAYLHNVTRPVTSANCVDVGNIFEDFTGNAS